MVTDLEQSLKDRVLQTTNSALDIVDSYLSGGLDVEDREKATMAFRLLSHGIKVLHMNQVRVLTERGQALRLLRWLPDKDSRNKYIEMTNPQAAPLMLSRPKE